MNRSSFQRWVALLCALAFGMNAMVLTRALVVCQDSNGTSRLEWGCAKDTAGHCADSCAESSESEQHHSESTPCSDAPISTQPCTANRAVYQQHLAKAFDLSPVCLAVVQVAPPMLAHEFTCRLIINRACPPPSWPMMQTVVLQV